MKLHTVAIGVSLLALTCLVFVNWTFNKDKGIAIQIESINTAELTLPRTAKVIPSIPQRIDLKCAEVSPFSINEPGACLRNEPTAKKEEAKSNEAAPKIRESIDRSFSMLARGDFWAANEYFSTIDFCRKFEPGKLNSSSDAKPCDGIDYEAKIDQATSLLRMGVNQGDEQAEIALANWTLSEGRELFIRGLPAAKPYNSDWLERRESPPEMQSALFKKSLSAAVEFLKSAALKSPEAGERLRQLSDLGYLPAP